MLGSPFVQRPSSVSEGLQKFRRGMKAEAGEGGIMVLFRLYPGAMRSMEGHWHGLIRMACEKCHCTSGNWLGFYGVKSKAGRMEKRLRLVGRWEAVTWIQQVRGRKMGHGTLGECLDMEAVTSDVRLKGQSLLDAFLKHRLYFFRAVSGFQKNEWKAERFPPCGPFSTSSLSPRFLYYLHLALLWGLCYHW